MRRFIIAVPIFLVAFSFCPARSATDLTAEGGARCCCRELDVSEVAASDPQRASRLKVVRCLRLLAQAIFVGGATNRLDSVATRLRRSGTRSGELACCYGELHDLLALFKDASEWQEFEPALSRVITGCPSGCFLPGSMISDMNCQLQRLNIIALGKAGVAGAITLSAPGYYVCAANITSSCESDALITITSPGVTWDLNGWTLSASGKVGVDIQASNVTIKNGRIDGCSTGVQVATAVQAVVLRDLTIKNCTSYGVRLEGLSCGLVHTVDCASNAVGVAVTTGGSSNATDIEVTNSVAQFSTGDGFVFDVSGSSGGPLVVQKSVAFENGGDGFDVTQNASSDEVLLKGNSAHRQSATGACGFRVTDVSPGVAVVNCYAGENTDDYNVPTATANKFVEVPTTSGNWDFWECYTPSLSASP